MQPRKRGVMVVVVAVVTAIACTTTPGEAVAAPQTLPTLASLPASSDQCFPNEPTGTAHPQAITDFGMDLFRQLVKEGNVFFSPFNLWSALLLTYIGAEGNTRLQMSQLLRLRGKLESLQLLHGLETEMRQRAAVYEGLSLEQASRVYIGDNFKIKPCVHTALLDRLQPIDFSHVTEAAEIINRFVKSSTRGLIPTIVQPDQLVDTKMAVVSAVYFYGAWQYTFNPELTQPRPFFRNPKERPENVQMMTMETIFGEGTSERLGARVLRLPYTSGTVAMYLLLPYKEGSEAFDATVNALSAAALTEAKSLLRNKSILVYLPKFKMEKVYGNNLKQALQILGATDMFDAGKVNLSSFSPDVFVSTVAHKAFVDVSEKGTEAAAATGVLTFVMSSQWEGPAFICDRPFVFLIYDEVANAVLFAGAYKFPPSAKTEGGRKKIV